MMLVKYITIWLYQLLIFTMVDISDVVTMVITIVSMADIGEYYYGPNIGGGLQTYSKMRGNEAVKIGIQPSILMSTKNLCPALKDLKKLQLAWMISKVNNLPSRVSSGKSLRLGVSS